MAGLEKLVQGVKVISIRVYGFGGASIFGACDFYRRLSNPRVAQANPGLKTTMQIMNDGLPPRVRVEFENGKAEDFNYPFMNADDYIREIDYAKSVHQFEEDAKEFEEEDPDPMEEVIAQELERRAKKAEKDRQTAAKTPKKEVKAKGKE